jgi:muramoyltetrapeptide carboxypeptidase LdcA involved in peptidoglycan recycling
MIPARLRSGDEIRVIAPSRSFKILSSEVIHLATERLKKLGLKLSFGKHCNEIDDWGSSSVLSRVFDLHDAFADPNVKGILTAIGGFNANQLLPLIDYDLIRAHPKIFCGFSDITVLQNAFYAKTTLVTYSGPHFSTFGCEQGIEYLIQSFQKMLFEDGEIVQNPSPSWSPDQDWYLDQKKRIFIPNEGTKIVQEGSATGTILGGNLSCFSSLQGTPFMPSLKGAILFLEEEPSNSAEVFDRSLQSLILQKDFCHVKGIVFGRCLQKLQLNKEQLKGVPILSGADFGHTLPIFTFPIGGIASLKINSRTSATEQLKISSG